MDINRYFDDKGELVNKRLRELLPKDTDHPKSLHSAMNYSMFAGGKRIRPILALAACEALGGDITNSLDAACALECIHTYSLIHDDLPALDNDDLRRGVPTCHKAFGEATAILAGDALLTIAFELMANMKIKDSAAIAKAIAELAAGAGSKGMIGGQAVDIESENADVDFATVEYIHIHKTGKLILASIRIGALTAGAAKAELAALTKYGESIGLAFQIADDILDVEGTPESLGKGAGGDAKKGKATYPALMGVDESRRLAKELAAGAIEALGGFSEKADPLRAIARFIVERKK